jgi:hypothetical protein
MCQHSRKVNETKARSFLKAGSTRVAEVIIDTILLKLVGVPVLEGIGLSIAIEIACFGLCYVGERLWNKVQWGRKIE